MNIFTKTFTDKELDNFKKAIVANGSLYKEFKGKIEKEPSLKKFFAENSAKNIAIELFGEKWLEQNPLYIERKKTHLCVALDNLKRLCKETKDPKEKGEKGNGKKVEQIQRELLYIQENFANYSSDDQNAIIVQIDHLLKGIKYKTTK